MEDSQTSFLDLKFSSSILSDTQSDYWDEIVLKSPDANFFQTSRWLQALEEAYDYKTYRIVTFTGRGDPIAFLPLAEVKSRLFGHRLISLPFCEYGGVSLIDSTKPNAVDSIHEVVKQILSETKADYLDYRVPDGTTTIPFFYYAGQRYINFHLQGLPAEIWRNIDRKLRNQIAKAEQSELSIGPIDTQEDLEKFYDLYSRIEKLRGSPAHSLQFFESVCTGFGMWGAKYKKQLISAVCIPFVKSHATWWLNVNEPEYRNMNATPLLLWHFIQSHSYENFTFDLGRTRPDSNIYNFKKQWGGQEFAIMNATSEMVSFADPELGKFKTASRIWKHLPVMFTNNWGPKIMKGIAL